MTDAELLHDCLTAFDALPTANTSRHVLKKWGIEPAAYAGDGRLILSQYMAKKLRDHFAAHFQLKAE